MRHFLTISRALAALVAVIGVISISAPASAAGSSCLPASIKAKLSQIRSKFGPIKIVSAHRPGARIAGTGKRSYHASCRAVDFHPPKGKYGQVVSWLKANHSGGVGTYSCGMRHIHIDNGGRVRFHKCVNSRGARIGKKGKRRYAYSKKRNKRYGKKSSKKYYANKKRSKAKKYKTYASKKKASSLKVARRAPNPVGKLTTYAR